MKKTLLPTVIKIAVDEIERNTGRSASAVTLNGIQSPLLIISGLLADSQIIVADVILFYTMFLCLVFLCFIWLIKLISSLKYAVILHVYARTLHHDDMVCIVNTKVYIVIHNTYYVFKQKSIVTVATKVMYCMLIFFLPILFILHYVFCSVVLVVWLGCMLELISMSD